MSCIIERGKPKDAGAVTRGGGGGGGRIWVLGFDFGGRKGWILGLGEGDASVWEEKRDFEDGQRIGF